MIYLTLIRYIINAVKQQFFTIVLRATQLTQHQTATELLSLGNSFGANRPNLSGQQLLEWSKGSRVPGWAYNAGLQFLINHKYTPDNSRDWSVLISTWINTRGQEYSEFTNKFSPGPNEAEVELLFNQIVSQSK